MNAMRGKVNHPKVSIIILNWNGLEDTIECLESLKKITYPNYEIVIVDNASSGNDVEVLKERYRDYIHIIANDKNYGFAEGNNIGMRNALQRNAAYVLLLNNDTVVDPEFLNELVNVTENDKGVGIVCPMIYWYDQPDIVWYGGRWGVDLYRGICIRKHIKESNQQVIETEFATGAAMLIKRETLERIGLLSRDYFFGVEDIDYSINALRKGFTIAVATKARVWHKGSKFMSVARVGYHYRGWQIMRRKYLSTGGYIISTVYALVWAVIRSLIPFARYILKGNRHEIITFLKKIPEALKGIIEGMTWRGKKHE